MSVCVFFLCVRSANAFDVGSSFICSVLGIDEEREKNTSVLLILGVDIMKCDLFCLRATPTIISFTFISTQRYKHKRMTSTKAFNYKTLTVQFALFVDFPTHFPYEAVAQMAQSQFCALVNRHSE